MICYYNCSNSQSFPEKRMELAEAQTLAAHGMQIAVVFQQRQNQVTDFTDKESLLVVERIAMRKTISANQPTQESI